MFRFWLENGRIDHWLARDFQQYLARIFGSCKQLFYWHWSSVWVHWSTNILADKKLKCTILRKFNLNQLNVLICRPLFAFKHSSDRRNRQSKCSICLKCQNWLIQNVIIWIFFCLNRINQATLYRLSFCVLFHWQSVYFFCVQYLLRLSCFWCICLWTTSVFRHDQSIRQLAWFPTTFCVFRQVCQMNPTKHKHNWLRLMFIYQLFTVFDAYFIIVKYSLYRKMKQATAERELGLNLSTFPRTDIWFHGKSYN